jgi:metal-responsive CopG/Arc/MetJ family transcriptional regulator
MMKTIQMTIDEGLLAEVDRVIRSLETNRSAFIRSALKLAIKRHEIREMEKRHAIGYAKYPVEKGEFDIWQDEQVWGRE